MKRWIHAEEDIVDKRYEVVLEFDYPFARLQEAEELCEVLDANNVKYKFYKSSGYWSHTFKVFRSGRTWNYIMKLINSVYPAKYSKVKELISEDEDGSITFYDEINANS